MVPNLQFRITKSKSYTSTKGEAKKRLNDAIQAYEQSGGLLSITQAAKFYVVSRATLYRKINGQRDQVSYGAT